MRILNKTPGAKIFHTDRFTRGGQIFSHEWRMRLQNMRVVVLLSLLFVLVGFALSFFLFDLSWWLIWDFYICSYLLGQIKIFCWPVTKEILYFFDQFLTTLMPGSKGIPSAYKAVWQLTTDFTTSGGQHYVARTVEFLKHPWTLKQLAHLTRTFWTISIFWAVGICFITWCFKSKSQNIEAGKIIEGKTITSSRAVARQIKKKKLKSDLRIAPSLPLIEGSETEHMMVIGTTGSGKTNCIYGLLNQIRRKGHKAIIFDTSCGYVNRYYDPHRGDIILNPFDTRSAYWDLWKDCRTTADFDQFAAALIPEPQGGENPIWYKTAREVISSTAEKLYRRGNPSARDLVDYANWKSLPEVQEFFVNTPVESLMNAKGRAQETVHGVRMQSTSAMKRIAMIPLEGVPFSISDWIINEQRPSWLFLSCAEGDRSSLGDLLKLWIDIAVQSLMKRGEDPHHRLWFILDELLSVESSRPLNNLHTLLRETRKYGGCTLLGFQSLAGLEKAYGVSGMREVVSLCNTKVILKTPEESQAHYLSKTLGDNEVIEFSESLSMGSHHMRDGVTMSGQRRIKPIISPSEIMSMRKYEAYVSLPADLPLCKVKFSRNHKPFLYKQEDYKREILLLDLLEKQRLVPVLAKAGNTGSEQRKTADQISAENTLTKKYLKEESNDT